MFKSFGLVFLGVLVVSQLCHAQNEQKLYGIVKDSLMLTPISGVSIHNVTAKKYSSTGEAGIFQVMVQEGDTLRYHVPGYLSGYYLVPNKKLRMDTVELWLRPMVHEDLPGVYVSSYTYKNYQADSTERMKEFGENVGFKTPTFSQSNSGAGLGIGLDALFGKKNKQKKKAFEVFKDEEKQRYIDFRFNKVLVHGYSGLKGARLQEFMHKYRPTYEWLRENPDTEALKYYINDRLKLYFQRPK
ncbi:MAG: hypothetical protein QM610_11970 [Chitinophagaceae bacterium]